MARTDPQLNFRCPAALKERLEVAADESGRSVTQEIIRRLEESFESPEHRDDLIRSFKNFEALYAGVLDAVKSGAINRDNVDALLEHGAKRAKKGK